MKNYTLKLLQHTTKTTFKFRKYSTKSKQPITLSKNHVTPLYDVVITGGGIVGSIFANILATSSNISKLKVLLLEGKSPIPSKHLKDRKIPTLRTCAITHKSRSLLKDIYIWDKIKNLQIAPYKRMEVWDTFSRGRISFDIETMRNDKFDSLGCVIENDVLQSVLYEKLNEISKKSFSNFDLLCPVKVKSIDFDGDLKYCDSIHIKLDNGINVKTRLLIGADGANSIVKKTFDFSAFGWDYGQKAVVATIKHESPNSTAFQRFLPLGPVGFLPCFGNYSSIVWSTSIKHANHLLKISNDNFLEDLNTAFRASPDRFTEDGKIPWMSRFLPESLDSLLPILFPPPKESFPPKALEVVGKRAAFPLKLIQSERYIKPRVALIGDACHVIHPMAGQGVNLGINDAYCLAKVISEAIGLGLDPGDMSVLQQYESQCKKENAVYLAAVDVIGRLYSVKNGPIALSRNIGMDLINCVPFVKDSLAKYAMGVNRINFPSVVV